MIHTHTYTYTHGKSGSNDIHASFISYRNREKKKSNKKFIAQKKKSMQMCLLDIFVGIIFRWLFM